jgi:hypothetical protein
MIIDKDVQSFELNLIYRFAIHHGIQDYESYSYERRWALVNRIFQSDPIHYKVLFDFLTAFERNYLTGKDAADMVLKQARERLVAFCKSNKIDIAQLIEN